jgi:hypothetical protein
MILIDFLKISTQYIEVLEVDKAYQFKLNDENHFQVELIDAKHCAGAVMYLFNG